MNAASISAQEPAEKEGNAIAKKAARVLRTRPIRAGFENSLSRYALGYACVTILRAMPRIRHQLRSMAYGHVQEEVNQGHSLRKKLYEKIESDLGKNKRVVAFFMSFTWPVLLQDSDADMLEEALHNLKGGLNGKELVLILNSPGGEALPAERIVNICRSFGNRKFSVIVPKMAKSAATMICFGADEIGMSQTSELGPIDPQIPIDDEHGHSTHYLAAHEILESYKELMDKANRTRGRTDPYLQQLLRFDARDIRRIVSAQQLSESIAVT